MTDIHVRKVDFMFPENLPVLAKEDDLRLSCEMAAISFTMPYLEPYLIRSMRQAVKEVRKINPKIADDMQNFAGQESNHFKNHARINDIIRAQLSPETAAKVSRLEQELENDYQRFSRQKTVRFNLVYAEAFEAMTLSVAEKILEKGFADWDSEWARLWEWHLAEEVEHRTVTFNAYDTLYGSYAYRMTVGIWAQIHYLRTVFKLAATIKQDFKAHKGAFHFTPIERSILRYMRTFSPFYNPSKIEASDKVKAVWAKYDALVAAEVAAE